MIVARHNGLYHCDYLEKRPTCKYCLGRGVVYQSYSPYNPEYPEQPPCEPCPYCSKGEDIVKKNKNLDK